MNIEEVVEVVLPIFPKIIMILKNEKVIIENKDGIANYVTNMDKKIENILIENILNKVGSSQIISEEQDNIIDINKNYEYKFVIDPIDGTTNFINSWPHAVSIGIISENEIAAGIICDFIQERIYVGIKNSGVYYLNINNMNLRNEVIKPKYIKTNIKKSVIAFDTPYGEKAFEETIKMYKKMYLEGASLKTVGPISLDVLKLALGIENNSSSYYDAVFHMEVRAWDLCAAVCILRELGGDIISFKGNLLTTEELSDYNNRIGFVASGNKELLNKIYDIYKK